MSLTDQDKDQGTRVDGTAILNPGSFLEMVKLIRDRLSCKESAIYSVDSGTYGFTLAKRLIRNLGNIGGYVSRTLLKTRGI